MQNALKTAFRFHMQNPRRVVTSRGLAFPNGIRAIDALIQARADVAEGNARYHDSYVDRATRQSDGMSYLGDKPENFGLRLVGRVQPDAGRHGIWETRANLRHASGYYADSYQSGVCYGLVYQLPARDGKARFVAAYDFSDRDGGLVFDLRQVFSSQSAGGVWDTDPRENDDAIEAARHADSLAEKAAEEAREYDQAWQAGNHWAEEQEALKQARQEALAILKERRAVKGQAGFPALCKAIAGQVAALRETMQEARDKATKLASGDHEGFWFWHGDKRLQGAFCEGAGLDTFPA